MKTLTTIKNINRTLVTGMVAILATTHIAQAGKASGGGGGYGDESSEYILSLASKELVQRLKNASPEIYVNLPKGSAQKLIELVDLKNIRREPEIAEYRDKRELMFNYREPQNGKPYLVALRLFYKAHASTPVNYMEPANLHQMKKEIQMRLLHEGAHVLGVGRSEKTDYKAREFAKKMLIAFDKDLLFCELIDQPSASGTLGHLFFLNRTSGYGMNQAESSDGIIRTYISGQNTQDFKNVFFTQNNIIPRYLEPTDINYGPDSWIRSMKRPIAFGSEFINFRFKKVQVQKQKTVLSFAGSTKDENANVTGHLREQLVVYNLNRDAASPATLTSEFTDLNDQTATQEFSLQCRSYYEVIDFKP